VPFGCAVDVEWFEVVVGVGVVFVVDVAGFVQPRVAQRVGTFFPVAAGGPAVPPCRNRQGGTGV